MSENWKPILGFEDYYEVSDLGRVKSLARIVPHSHTPTGTYHVKPRFMKAIVMRTRRDGVPRFTVNLRREGKMYTRYIAALVLETFKGLRPTGYETRHLNGDPSDDRLDNLAWGTTEDNRADFLSHGGQRGERNGNVRLNDAQVLEIRKLRASGVSRLTIAAQFGIAIRTVTKISKKEIWSHV